MANPVQVRCWSGERNTRCHGEAGIVRSEIESEQHARERKRERQHDAEHVAHHVEAEQRENGMDAREADRDGHERQAMTGHRLDDRLKAVRADQRLGGEPVRRGHDAVRRAEQAGAPEAERGTQGHLARQTVVDAHLGDGEQEREASAWPTTIAATAHQAAARLR